ncbi:hypothetical protein GZH47_08190 [Paenibacillus rhizovicinus]|uniref:Uncharacterized protein n=1 Tax=Paenibacillus rhizovicinus TaxID=2704463 RepID=A0A6C0NYP7_9BACL|nr:hypothetical protein [Paenibacillus rhizovicinus]QHW30833.1 hypothetical protein GZH47_08190 [Paenibacillus rhizovicinus]
MRRSSAYAAGAGCGAEVTGRRRLGLAAAANLGATTAWAGCGGELAGQRRLGLAAAASWRDDDG